MNSCATDMLKDKVVLVTGGGRGLGAAICSALFQAGAKVAIADVRLGSAQTILDQLSQSNPPAGYLLAVEMDVGSDVSVTAAIGAVEAALGPVDVLINNAGVDYTLSVEELGVDQWDHVIATNLSGPFLLSRAVIKQMRERGHGHIVNIASTAAKRTWPNAAAYHASKWGLLGLSHAMHAELRPHGIKVTAVVTGGMSTPFLLDRFPDIDVATLQPPETVAAAVLQVLLLPGDSVIPEITVLPMRETSWP
jgi:NAD(P)-dependent dehydrogenase (short-subunit alcohol dehydrogenase family)